MSGISEQDIEHIAPLSGLQQSMLFRSLAEPNSGHYIEQLSYEFSDFDIGAMQAALDAIIATRSAMRTSFLWREQALPRQLTFRSVSHPIELKEIDSSSGRLTAEQKSDAIAADRARGLKLNQAPLMRLTVFMPAISAQNSRQVYVFCIWTFHHAVVDGWSIALLQHELLNYYAAYRSGRAPNLPTTETTLIRADNRPQENLGIWDQHLNQANRDSALAFLPSPLNSNREYAEVEYCCDSDAGARFRTACQTHRVTFANFAHAAWSLLLCHLNGQRSTLYGTIDSGRSYLKDGENAVGMFMQLLPISIDIDESQPLETFLREIQRRQWVLQTDHLPSPSNIALALERAPGDELFDTLLLVQNYPAAVMPENLGLLESKGFEQADAPLVLSVGNTDTLRMLARIQTDRLDTRQASAMQNHFAGMLTVLANAAGTLTLGEILDQFAAESIDNPLAPQQYETSNLRCIVRFNEATQRHPENIAVIDANRSYTFAALASRAEHIRELLSDAGVTDKSTVAVCQTRSLDSVASSLAILAQGASFVPIDPSFPASIVESMLNDSGAQFALTSDPTKLKYLSQSTRLVLLPDADSQQHKPLTISNSANSIMCVMFTSGSTGKPRGIALTHAAVINRLGWMEKEYPFVPSDVCAARTPVNFVDAVAEVFGPLCAGISCRIISDKELHSLGEFVRIVEHTGISRISLVPSLLNALLMELGEHSSWPSVRLCIVSGEALSQQLVIDYHQKLPHSRLLNLYGSTEVAADALFYETSADLDRNCKWAPIGKPIDNMSAQICNALGRVLPRGVIGELHIQGLGVATAYINDSDLSASKFIDDRFLSGDLAFADAQGLFHFIGRADRQIKVRGQRVEPGAIEAVIVNHPDVHQSVVSLVGQNLLCFYTGKQQPHQTLDEFARGKLPAYSLPSRYWHLDEIPLTHSGKTDFLGLQQLVVNTAAPLVNASTTASLSLHQRELGLTIGNIWSELLPHASISTNTDFFEAGGHSLLAMQMIASVERALGMTVPLAVFMSNTRLADFAKVLFDGIPKLSAPELITLRDGNASAPALFCIQGDAYNIVPHCQIDRKIYWISQWSTCVDLTKDPVPVPIESIQQTAERYTRHIERVHPKGELCILAACGAAVISMEVARILQRKGRTPSKLVLMDLPRGKLTTASERGLKHRQERNIFLSAYHYLMRVGGGKKLRDYLHLNRIKRKISRGTALSDIEAAELMNIRLSEALSDYQPKAYHGEVELILSKAWYRGVEKAENASVPEFWRPYLPKVSAIHFSTADHHSDLLQGDAAVFAVNVIES